MKLRDKNGKFVKTRKEQKCSICENMTLLKYCSRECYYKMKRIRKDRVNWTSEMRSKLSNKYTGKGNPAAGKPGWSKGKKRLEITGINHPNYKGGYINKDGYKYISVSGREVAEHHYLIEQKIGRRLIFDEVVHHINHNKLDNRIENLILLTRKEHVIIHPAWKFLDK